MTNKPQPPVGQSYHEVLADHRSNMTKLQQRAVEDAVGEYRRAVERIEFLEKENGALTQDVATLTRKLHAREEVPPKRARPQTNGHGNGNGRRPR